MAKTMLIQRKIVRVMTPLEMFPTLAVVGMTSLLKFGFFVSSSFLTQTDSQVLSSLRRPVWRFDTELLGVFCVQALPSELHGIRADDASEGSSPKQVIENIET